MNKDKFAEIEIKVKKRDEAEDGVMKHGLTIHVKENVNFARNLI